ncbi:transglutaminase-like domain-containing protein [Alkalimarinus sediminis]|uniref:Transglutaminase-like domain-containing protein n=1 Tax=Alkalimarinus sediminis TaxID=1632866 RepID=A0A9E8HI77_9ALTE|nr:transglutaminase-like domain-containing protein [Alkalimarinus sediminis]UZW75148.1 transglutaminase-like domain-containing protein [Alkalimarinus sediminis]
MSDSLDQYLVATQFYDFDNELVQQWADRVLQGVSDDPIDIAKALYLAARDEVSYNPYVFSTNPKSLSASHVLEARESYCIPKAVLLGAAARYKGIPARLGLADVKNHLSSPRLIEFLRSDIFRMHGYIELYLDGRWVKATPAFNKRLCMIMKVEPLAFDGVNDSIFQPYTDDGAQHMEYVQEHGEFVDVPFEFIMEGIRTAYPHLFNPQAEVMPISGDLESEV